MAAGETRMLIIGASGFVGGHLARMAAGRFQVFSGSRRAPISPDHVALDVTSPEMVREAFARVRPQVVVHLAAISDIDRCEQEKELAEAVNVRGTAHVVDQCARGGARLFFASSGAVFDGTRHGYTEQDPPTPVSFYGETKARAEALITRELPSAVILRCGLVLGAALQPGSNALGDKLVESFRAGRPVVVPTYEFRNPIDAPTLAEFFLELAAYPQASGIFHVGSSDSLSRYELVAKMAEKMGYPRSLVVPRREPIPGRAPRGPDQFLLTDKIRRVCRTPVPTCEEVIERCVHAVSVAQSRLRA